MKLSKIYFEFFYLETTMDSHEAVRNNLKIINLLIYFLIMESSQFL